MNRAIIVAALLCAAAAGCKQDVPAGEGATQKVAPKKAEIVAGKLTASQQAQGKALVQNSCLACHTSEMVEQQRLTPAQWQANVKKMQGWGAPLEQDEPELVAAYLAQHHGLDAGAYQLPEIHTGEAEAQLAPLPDGDLSGGDTKRGEQVYRTSCATCHGNDGKGAALGVNLIDRPVLYRAPDFSLVVIKGRNRMPETTGIQKPDIAAVLAYLRTLRG
jgi:mono/diheme cytochrome c family protein